MPAGAGFGPSQDWQRTGGLLKEAARAPPAASASREDSFVLGVAANEMSYASEEHDAV